MSSKYKLNSCECGGEPKLEQVGLAGRYVGCSSCGCRSKIRVDWVDAAAEWNKGNIVSLQEKKDIKGYKREMLKKTPVNDEDRLVSKYQNSAEFYNLVSVIEQFMVNHQVTPQDIRDAAFIAAVKIAARTGISVMGVPSEPR